MAARSQGARSRAPEAPEQITYHAAVPRLGDPGRTYTLRNALGVVATLTADDAGVVRPQTMADVQLCDAERMPAAPGTYSWQERRGAPIETGTFEAPPEGFVTSEPEPDEDESDDSTGDEPGQED